VSLHRITRSAALIGFTTLALGAPSALAVPAKTKTVTLLAPAAVRAYPGSSAPRIGSVAATRPITGSPTTLPVLEEAFSAGARWVRVLLPQRPDSSAGWISTNGTQVSSDPWRIEISRSRRQATIYHSGRVARTFSVVVGRPSMPTPAGSFFVAESVYEGYGAVTGPYALATSAYSNVLTEFDGGPGQVALHGRIGLPEPLGTASSHGCVRFANADITWLATHVSVGTPIDIS